MKAFFITSMTNETYKHHESFAGLPGNEIACYVYSARGEKGYATGAALDAEIYAAAKQYGPDLIVYIGAAIGNKPSAELFRKLRDEIAPTVHFCSDAADDPWWPLLIEYDNLSAFDVQVSLDGNKNWPLAKTQITALTVVASDSFPATPKPHAERPIPFGFAGNCGDKRSGGRWSQIEPMIAMGLQCRARDGATDSYPAFVEFLGRCRLVVNFPQCGSRRHMHVKGRVIETGLAGALLLEQRGAPTSDWFVPDADYLEYGSTDEIREIVKHYANRPAESQAIAERLRTKVLVRHGPVAFWKRILDRIPSLSNRLP